MFDGALETTRAWLARPRQVPSRGWQWMTQLPKAPNWPPSVPLGSPSKLQGSLMYFGDYLQCF